MFVILLKQRKKWDKVHAERQAIVEDTFTGGTHMGTLEPGEVSLTPFPSADGGCKPPVNLPVGLSCYTLRQEGESSPGMPRLKSVSKFTWKLDGK